MINHLNNRYTYTHKTHHDPRSSTATSIHLAGRWTLSAALVLLHCAILRQARVPLRVDDPWRRRILVQEIPQQAPIVLATGIDAGTLVAISVTPRHKEFELLPDLSRPLKHLRKGSCLMVWKRCDAAEQETRKA